MYQIWYKEFLTDGQVSFYSSLVSCKQILLYRVIILSAHISGIARTAVSFSNDILNSNESNKTYLSASVSKFLMADFKDGSLFYDKYKYRSLKYGLHRYPAWISLISMGRCVPLYTFLCITSSILSMSVCFGKYLWIKFPLFKRSPNSLGF